MNYTERRKVLTGSKCVLPASVFDPLSARVAEAVGFEIGLVGGSLAAAAVLAAPDLVVHTLTEYADQIRRITRVSRLSLFVDADNGYGNALNVMRTVQEFEHAGVAGIAIEDTVAPIPFGQAGDEQKLISIEEGIGKMRAALAAREDPSLVIAARTPALKIEGLEGMIARAKAYAATGVDALHITGGRQKLEHFQAVYAAAKLPLIIGQSHVMLNRDELAACGARIVLPGHQAIAVAAKALQETYTHLFNGGAPADLKSRIASAPEMEQLVNGESYQQWLREYMR